MKKVTNTYRLLAVAAVMMVSMSLAPAAQASVANKEPFELKWIGNQGESPVFKLTLSNAAAGEYTVVIKDENKQVLYAEKLKGNIASRLYKLQNQGPELEDADITFEVTDRSTNTTVIYRVSTSVQFQSATEVTIIR